MKLIGIILMVLNTVLLVPFSALTIYGLVESTIIPADYVELDKITITDNGFSVNNEEYIEVKYTFKNSLHFEYENAFSYAPEGKFNQSTWCNVKKINIDGFDYYYIPVYVSKEGRKVSTFFVKSSEYNDIVTYYENNHIY